MLKKIFSRKKSPKEEVVSLSEIEKRLENLIEKREEVLSEFVSSKLSDFGVLIHELILEVNNLEPSSMHPRLKGAAKNFKSVSVELWGNIDLNNFEQIENAMKKTLLMKLKHYRILFGVNPPELEPVNRKLTEIASKIEDINTKKTELKLDELREISNNLMEIRDKLGKKEQILYKIGRIRGSIKKMEDEKEQPDVADVDLTVLEGKVSELDGKIQMKEKEIQKKIAISRKPLKMYLHMIGSNVKDFDFSSDDITVMADRTISEIKKGNIKVKESQLEDVLESLTYVSSGNLKEKLREIGNLKMDLIENKNALNRTKLKAGQEKTYEGKKSALNREKESYERNLEEISGEILAKKENIEKKINDCLNTSFKIELEDGQL